MILPGATIFYSMDADLILLNESWLNGSYPNGEIDVSYSTVAVTDPEWFFQGWEADQIIKEIHQIWLAGDCTQEEAFNQWINMYLY